jgi:hypothetical protein
MTRDQIDLIESILLRRVIARESSQLFGLLLKPRYRVLNLEQVFLIVTLIISLKRNYCGERIHSGLVQLLENRLGVIYPIAPFQILIPTSIDSPPHRCRGDNGYS